MFRIKQNIVAETLPILPPVSTDWSSERRIITPRWSVGIVRRA